MAKAETHNHANPTCLSRAKSETEDLPYPNLFANSEKLHHTDCHTFHEPQLRGAGFRNSAKKCYFDPAPIIIASPTERASPPVPRERLETYLYIVDTSSIHRRTRRTRAVKHPRRVDDTEVRLAEIYLA